MTAMREAAAVPNAMWDFIDAFNWGDRARIATLLQPDVAYSTSFGEILRGAESVTERLWAWRAAFPDLEFEVTGASHAGEQGSIEGYLRGTQTAGLVLPRQTVSATGKQIRVPQSYLFTLEDEKIGILSSHVEGAVLLRALGKHGHLPTVPILPAHLALLYQQRLRVPRRERLFLASVSFGVTFGLLRLLVHAIRANRGPFRNISGPGGTHVHHLVWGILFLLATGYLWLAQIGTGVDASGRWKRSTAVLYGAGSALTLDEFALWLNLEDVYWAPQGRESIDAVMLFGSVLVAGWWGFPFFRDVYHLLTSLKRGTAHKGEAANHQQEEATQA